MGYVRPEKSLGDGRWWPRAGAPIPARRAGTRRSRTGSVNYAAPPVSQLGQLARSPAPQHGPLGQFAHRHKRDAPGLTRQPGAQRIIQAPARACRRDVGVQDDEAYARPERREAYRSARNASHSPSESNSPGRAMSSTDSAGRTPWRRASSSTGTSSAAGRTGSDSRMSRRHRRHPPAGPFSHVR